MIERLIALIVAIITIIIYAFQCFIREGGNGTYSGGGSNSTRRPRSKARGGQSLVSGEIEPIHQCRILTFNIEYEATNYSPKDIVEIFNSVGADTVILNEAHGEENRQKVSMLPTKLTATLASNGLNYVFTHDWAIVASKHPLSQPHKGSRNKYLDSATLVNGKYYVITVHLTDYPYQPFQLAKIPYCYNECQKNICRECPKAEEEMISAATAARGSDVDLIIAAINTLRYKEKSTLPVIIAGDFNEPSHLDWTESAVKAGIHPLKVAFPTSSRLQSAGIVDLYRVVHPDPIANPGYTWPARQLTVEELRDLSKGQINSAISTPADRIDYIYGMGVRPIRAEVLQTPSDHNAVMIDIITRL